MKEKMSVKSIVYRVGKNISRLYWRVTGCRRVLAFGENYRFAPHTVVPNYRTLRLPKEACRSRIVRYTEYVQIHLLCDYLSRLERNPILIDIGAYQGVYAVIMGKIAQAKSGKVIAVEPNPESFELMLENIRLNRLSDTVFCEQVGISDRPGKTWLQFQGSETYITSNPSSCQVDVLTLEQLLNKHRVGRVDLLMIDVEGAELPVLRGFPWGHVTCMEVICELHPYAWKDFSYSSSDMQSFLVERNFRCFDMFFREYTAFDTEVYIGPTLFVPDRSSQRAGESQ